MASRFVHLHAHSEYSLLDGANRIDKLVERTKELEMPAVALTDHGVMFGAHEFYKQAKKAGITPIIGMEAYVAPGTRHDRERVQGEKGYYHLVMLARDIEGYRNLSRLSSIGFTEGFYGKPRIDREVIERHSEGIIVTSACLAGEIAQHLMANRWDAAREAASWYAEIFKGRFYLEVQAHDTPDQADLNARIFKLSEELGIPVVATNDAHFLTADDHQPHDMLLCIGMGKDYDDPDRMRYDRGLYFKSTEEMLERFPDRPDVLENTLDIADQVDLVFEKKYHVPAFPLPEDVSSEADLLRKLTKEGAEEIYGSPLPEHVAERVEYELKVICDLGFAGYFLILQDVINWCRANDIPVGPGRGSAAGSIVAYAVGITDIDPLKYDLLFERFLNPDRATMPDIDTDFAQEGRQDAIAYVRRKYGEEAVSQIITFGTLGAKGVLKDVGRVLGYSPGDMNRLTAKIPTGMTLDEAIEQVPEVRQMADSMRTQDKDLIRFAQALEGLARHSSIHAGGVVIAPGPLEDYIPVATQASAGGRRLKVTQYDMNAVEEQGLLKFDFLGIKTLDQRDYARQLIRERYGRAIVFDVREEKRIRDRYGDEIEVVMASVEDPCIYELLRAGRTAGIFQLESNLATDKIRAMRADRFEDIVATNALIRPGPLDTGMTERFIRRKRGDEAVDYPHPDLEDVLEPTLGIIVYQEQVMRTAQKLAGYTLAEADILRKAVGKKDAELIRKEIKKFVERSIERGVDRLVAEKLGADIEAFGRYGFNKSHSAAYSLLSAQSAYLKANYPAEFLAGVLSFESSEKMPVYLAEARDMGIAVLSPSVNESAERFNVVTTPDGKAAIRFGLGAVKNVGSVAHAIIAERTQNGAFENFFDFVDRMKPQGLQRKSLECLIDAGACDEFGHRAQLLHAVDVALSHAEMKRQEAEKGQGSLFDMLDSSDQGASIVPELPDVPPMAATVALAKEKELMGFYISGHPMDSHEKDAALVRSRRLVSAGEGERMSGSATLVGIVTSVESRISKRGTKWGTAVIEDITGAQVVKAFGKEWERYGHKFEEGAVVVVRGRYQDDDPDNDSPDFFAEQVDPLEVAVAEIRQKERKASPATRRDRTAALDAEMARQEYERQAAFDAAALEVDAAAEPVVEEVVTASEGEEIYLRLRVPRPIRKGDALAEQILRTLGAHSGGTPVQFAVRDGEFRTARSTVDASEDLLAELKAILGEDEVFLHPAPPARARVVR